MRIELRAPRLTLLAGSALALPGPANPYDRRCDANPEPLGLSSTVNPDLNRKALHLLYVGSVISPVQDIDALLEDNRRLPAKTEIARRARGSPGVGPLAADQPFFVRGQALSLSGRKAFSAGMVDRIV